MIILFALVILLASWTATQLLRRAARARTAAASTRHAGRPYATVSALLRRAGTPVRQAPAGAELPSGASSSPGTQDGLTWTALDDLQLTRLLTDAARRTNPE